MPSHLVFGGIILGWVGLGGISSLRSKNPLTSTCKRKRENTGYVRA